MTQKSLRRAGEFLLLLLGAAIPLAVAIALIHYFG